MQTESDKDWPSEILMQYLEMQQKIAVNSNLCLNSNLFFFKN